MERARSVAGYGEITIRNSENGQNGQNGRKRVSRGKTEKTWNGHIRSLGYGEITERNSENGQNGQNGRKRVSRGKRRKRRTGTFGRLDMVKITIRNSQNGQNGQNGRKRLSRGKTEKTWNGHVRSRGYGENTSAHDGKLAKLGKRGTREEKFWRGRKMDVFAAPTTVYPSFTSWRAGVQRGSEFPGYIRGGWFPPGSCVSHGTRAERGRVFYGKHIDFVGICVSFAYVAVGCHGR